jgi:hypothetical protein
MRVNPSNSSTVDLGACALVFHDASARRARQDPFHAEHEDPYAQRGE